MVTRIATFALNDRMLAASLRTQAKMGEVQVQEASGSVSTDYGGLGGSAKTLVSLEVSLARSKAYANAADEAGSRIDVMYDALTSMTDMLSSFRASLSGAISASTTDASDTTLISTAQNYLTEFASLLNTQFEGRYLFAGSDTTQPAVDLTNYAATDVDTADTSYYQGNATTASVRVSSERTVNYGVTGDDTAFEQALRALSAVANATTTPDSDTLQAISDLVVSAVDAVSAVQGRLSVNAATLERASATQADYQDFTSGLISDVRDVDITAVAAQLSSYETQLQASYAALAKIQSLNLLDYLK
ncbi:flagellin [Bosea psychrotolerans]|uniref:Flagellin n=1 Tax=Bosea psychrotolerans TaxID=1871628 RepID=A0A2S4MAY0_9HYPH|nr:flagellin [Bosea psychrotolerans]POR51893.1 flagellar hook-associated protein 3 FlgL [Bosea psychrotolerans]